MTKNLNLNFKENPVQEITIEQLEKTRKEKDVMERPIHGIHHIEFINNILLMTQKTGVDAKIKSIKAINNKSRKNPGIVTLDELIKEKGNIPEAYMIRRLMCDIEISNFETDDINSKLSFIYSNNGLEVGLGPNVKSCSNMCILSAERAISNYGNDKVSLNNMMEIIDDWCHNFEPIIKNDIKTIQKMKKIDVTPGHVERLIGKMTSKRIIADSKPLRNKLDNNKYKVPMTQSQIGQFTENYLIKLFDLKQEKNTDKMSLWEMYNIGTELHKPEKQNVTKIISYNQAFSNIIVESLKN